MKAHFQTFITFLITLLRKPKDRKPTDNKARQSYQEAPEITDSSKQSTANLQQNNLQQNDIQKEIRDGRKFTLAEAIGRESGSFMKGDSSIPRPLRAATQINQFITKHSTDPAGALPTTLCTWANNDIRVSRQLDTPLVALAQIIESTLNEPTSFCELARQVAITHSQLTGDRPYFQSFGQPPHPEAEYTHDAISAELLRLKDILTQQLSQPPT